MLEQEDRKKVELLEKVLLKYSSIETFYNIPCSFCRVYKHCSDCKAPDHLCNNDKDHEYYYNHIAYIGILYDHDLKYMKLFWYVLKNMYWQIYMLLVKKYQVWKAKYPGEKT